MKGFLVFCGLIVTLGLLAATLSYVDHRQKTHSSTLVGALGSIEESIEISHGLNVSFHKPWIDTTPDSGRWTLTGTLVTGNSVNGSNQAPFTAVLVRHCESDHDSSCWSMEEFRVAGVRQSLSGGWRLDGGAAHRKATLDRFTESLHRQLADTQEARRRLRNRYGQDASLRAQTLANTISRTGLDADQMVSEITGQGLASGGPLIATRDATAHSKPNAGIASAPHGLDEQWDRLFALEALLSHLPMAAPLKHYRFSSTFGERTDPMTGERAYHSGLDLVGPPGSLIHATAAGTVIFAGNRGRYGNMVAIDHGHGISTRYGHLSKIFVESGQPIELGQKIAIMGNSGRSTGPHLHYEVRSQYRALDPLKFLRAGTEATGKARDLSTIEQSLATGGPASDALLLVD